VGKIRNYSLLLTEQMASKHSLRIRFLGDISFNDAYIDILEAGQDPFCEVKPLLKDADFVVGNLECLAKGKAQNLLKKPRISTTAKALNALNGLNLGLVSLATNHYYDNLQDGFETTTNKLKNLGIDHLGATLVKQEINQPYIFESNGWRIGFLNYVHPDTNPKAPKDASVYANIFDVNFIQKQVKELKGKVDRVVLLLHWGGKSDYGYLPHKEQIAQARQMIDSGADTIIGHHTHTFQAQMRHNGKPIFFSLGNFCFADIHCESGIYPVRESGKKGAIVELEFFENGEIKEQIFSFRIKNLKLLPDNNLKSTFRNWSRFLSAANKISSLYALYNYAFKRWEPVHFHVQLNNTSMLGLAISKIKRKLGLL